MMMEAIDVMFSRMSFYKKQRMMAMKPMLEFNLLVTCELIRDAECRVQNLTDFFTLSFSGVRC